MTGPSRFVPWVVLGIAGIYLLAAMAPASESPNEPALSEFGTLPVQDGGRVKPIDTYARVQLMLVSSRQEFTDEFGNTGQPAVLWVLDVLADGLERWYSRIPVPDAQVRNWLGLPDRPFPLFTMREVIGAAADKKDRLQRILETKGERNPVEENVAMTVMLAVSRKRSLDEIEQARKVKKLDDAEKTNVFRIENDQLLSMLGLERREGLRYNFTEIVRSDKFRDFLPYVEQAGKLRDEDDKLLDLVQVKALDLYGHLRIYDNIASLKGARMVPPTKPGGEWMTLADALDQGENLTDGSPAKTLENIILAHAAGDAKKFNAEVKAYQKQLARILPREMGFAQSETWFNHFAPFYQALCLYVLVFLLAALSWLCWPEALSRSAFWLGIGVVVVHTFAIGMRIYLQGRPPVTNLYSSAVFIGWGCVLLCLFIEYLFRNTFGSIGAAVMGFATLIIAHHLSASGDTLEMMQAVLDTNFWLATHVTTVTLGYTATFVAGFFGFVYVIGGLLTTALDAKARKTLAQIIYGVVCFATLLSFVGTVLGGIWADQSWGRFWGWDPKENGAVLIVIMNALILHARWGGLVKDRGMAVLVMVGNMVTMWSWFGTNQLGIGLHAYGFNKALVLMCRYFWLCQLGVIVAGLVPLRYWRSFQEPLTALPKAPPTKPAPRPGPRGSTGIQPA
jgi:ABC-type transport system involved in cytochrome c biogenesis permease subunit